MAGQPSQRLQTARGADTKVIGSKRVPMTDLAAAAAGGRADTKTLPGGKVYSRLAAAAEGGGGAETARTVTKVFDRRAPDAHSKRERRPCLNHSRRPLNRQLLCTAADLIRVSHTLSAQIAGLSQQEARHVCPCS
jgi:hypothetical protein